MLLGYVKSRATFKQTHKLQIVDFDYCINSAYENVSMFIVMGEHSGLEDSFFVCDEFFGVITSCTPDKGLTTIQCAKIVTIFGRQLVLTEGESYIEDFMKRVIEDEFKNLSDSVYAMPYINVTITSHTAYSRPVNDNKIWQLEKYISRVKRLFDIYTDITVDNNTLQVTIGHRNVPTHNVDFATSTFELISETYSSEAVSKISVVGEGAITDYYLFDDGTYGTDPTQGTRVKGKWEFRESADNIGYVFASNMDSHLIQFRSFKRFEFGDKLCIRSNGRVTYTYINQILRDSKDDRYLYKTGQITETASETISEQGEDIADIQQELEFNTVKKDGDSDVNGSISVTGSLYSDGDIYENGVRLADKYGGGGGGGGGTNNLVTLWTNSNPSADFNGQVVTLADSADNYDMLIFVSKYGTGDTRRHTDVAMKGETKFTITTFQESTTATSSDTTMAWRNVTISGTSATINNAMYNAASAGGYNRANICIPLYIYGANIRSTSYSRAKELLWTNPSPTSTFSPQTITLSQNAKQFDALLVETQYSITISNKHLDCIGNNGRYNTIVPRTGTNTTYIIAWRDLVVNENTIEISQALTKNLTTGGVDNGCAVPMNIYGIKFGGSNGTPLPTEYTASGSTTTYNSISKSWTVHGSGFVFVSCYVVTDSTNSYGSTWANIEYDGAYVAMNKHRLNSNSADTLAASSSIMISVTNGKTISCYCGSTEDGTKTAKFRAMAFGCTLT